MAAFAVACGAFFFLLPETHNKPMPGTVNQVDSSGDVLMKDGDSNKKNGLPLKEL